MGRKEVRVVGAWCFSLRREMQKKIDLVEREKKKNTLNTTRSSIP